MLLIPSGIFSLCHGTMDSASWGLFLPPFSTDVWKWGLWTCEAASNTEPESCGRLSVALTRLKFLLPHSLETWRFMIAVVCLSLLWLPYLSQKKPHQRPENPKQNKKEPTPDWAPWTATVFHVSQWPLVSSDDREGEPILAMAGISWLADTSPYWLPSPVASPLCVLPNAFSLWSCQTA